MTTLLHSYWAYAVLLLLLVAIINAILGLSGSRSYQKKDRTLALLALIGSHVQLLLGLGVFFIAPAYIAMKAEGMSYVMKDSYLRSQLVEHPLLMIIGIILITIGFSRHKSKPTDQAKFKTIAIYYGIGLVLILVKIPWGDWF